MSETPEQGTSDIEAITKAFADALPEIDAIANLQHRRLSPSSKEEAVAETIARTWHTYRKMALEGRDPTPLLPSMVRYAAKHVRAGKLLAGKEKVRDVMSRASRSKHDYFVTSLPNSDDENVAGEVRAALRHRVPDPADEAICRADYEAWLKRHNEKYRAVAEGLAAGMNMTEIAQEMKVSKARVQQMATRLKEDWDEFQGGSRSR